EVLPQKIESVDFWALFSSGEWEPLTFEFYKKYVRPDKDVIDIGGWIGPTMLIAYSLNPRQIHMVEADPVNFQIMKMNCFKNYCQDKIQMQNICLSDKSGDIVEFGWTDASRLDSSTKSMNSKGGIKVLITDILEYLKSKDLANVNIIKIDIEGAESLLSKGLDYIAGFPGIKILLSLHPPFWDDKKKTMGKLIPEIKKFDVFTEDDKPLSLNDLQEMMQDETESLWPGKTGKFFTIILKTRDKK
ncbi:MAG: FkbM family methyltransferase, partial [Alphaproteobacteria bacterium]|nr:FkbM family methyltransferase [Alphaproteobacteria bacterium]